MDTIPCRIRNMPTTVVMATRLAMGDRNEKKPAHASRTPVAVNQPQPRTPRRCRSKEFTNLVMPEKISHIPKMNGRVSAVNHPLPRTNRDRSTVRIPSSRNHPDPAISL